MHLSSSQVCVIRFYLFNGVFYQSLAGVTYNILAPPRRFAMAQLLFRACSGLSLSSSLASHPQAPSGPFSVTQSYLTLCEPMNFSLPSSPVHETFQARKSRVDCHFLLQGNLPDSGIEPRSPVSPALEADSFPLYHLGSPKTVWSLIDSLYREASTSPLVHTKLWGDLQGFLLKFTKGLDDT